MALGTPFIYFPIEGHYEQELVAARLQRYGAGARLSLADTTPEMLAEAIAAAYARGVEPVPLPVDGARRAGEHIVGTLDRGRSTTGERTPAQ
jgi:predicted glycosyltransferase